MSRGTSSANSRGGVNDRRRRKCWMLATFGDGVSVKCYACPKVLLFSTLQPDRIIPGALGGTYRRDNLRPCCGACNIASGNRLRALLSRGVPRHEILAACLAGTI